MKKKIIVAVDIDDTLCRYPKKYLHHKDKYSFSKPIRKNVNLVNLLINKGYYIKLYTARGMSTYKKDLIKIENKFRNFTIKQLKNWGVRYHELIFGKENYDIIIDDKSVNLSKTINLNKLI